jgi:hypothetical protein
MTIPEQTVKIPEIQPSPRDSRQCLASTAHRGLAEGILVVLAQLEAVPMDPLQLPSSTPVQELLSSLFKLFSWFFDDSLLSSILILQLLNLHLLGSTPMLEIFNLLSVLLRYSSNLLVMMVLTDFFT